MKNLTRFTSIAAIATLVIGCGKVDTQVTAEAEPEVKQTISAPHIGTWEVTLKDTEQKARWRFSEKVMSFKERYHHPYQSQEYSYKIDGKDVLVSHPGSTDDKHFVKISMIDENNAILQVKENKTATLKRVTDGPDEARVLMISHASEKQDEQPTE